MKIPDHVKLPSEVSFQSDLPLLVYRPRGVLNEAAVSNLIGFIGELESTIQQPFNRFFDTLEAKAIDLNFRFVLQASVYRRLTHGDRPLVKSAILATDSTITHYARLLAVLTRGSQIKVKIFQDRQQAADWLAVPIDRLKADWERQHQNSV